jgi:ADP-ribose pyrophosphatase YjhB (NUDIX family)
MIKCPHCGREVTYRNPVPTVDIIIETQAAGKHGIVLIERKNPPHGWALPGGFVDYGESLEQAAVREAAEETGLDVELIELMGAYSDPDRDPRQHTITNVFIARASGEPQGRSDAARADIFNADTLPAPLAFDHHRILTDYFQKRGLKTSGPQGG